MKFIYKKKINQKKDYLQTKEETLKFPPSSSSSPTPPSPLLLPLGVWYFLQNIKAYI